MTKHLRTIGFGLALAWSGVAALPAAAQLSTVTLNPNGGMTAGDGLRIALSYGAGGGANPNATPFLQVYRAGSGQIYDPEDVEAGSRAYLGVGPTGSGVTVGSDEPWTSTDASLSTVTGTGSAADPWRATLSLRTRANGDAPGFTLAQTLSYVVGEDTVLLALTVTPPANNTQPVKLYHETDTNLDALEEGPAWVRPGTSNPRVVGVARMEDPEGFIGYLRVDPFTHFFAGDCCTAAGMDGAGDLGDVINTDPDSDKLLAVQFSLGVITAPTTVSVRMGFRGAPCTGAGGTAAAPDTGCTAGSPACDPDAAICVPCTNVGFCSNAVGCDDGLQRCRACADSMSAAGMDSGCGAAAPICDAAVPLGSCGVCVDDTAGVSVDSGCSAGVPLCAAGGGGRACVVCVDDALLAARDTGCSTGEPLCDTSGAAPACASCVNDVNGAGQDSGCAVATPICAGAECVACSDDVTGDGIDSGCDAGEPRCDTSGASPTCVALCSDDQTGAAIDRGCSAAAPVCDTRGATAHCTPCFDDGAGMATDTGCSAGAPLCDTSGAAPVCVACDDSAEGAEDVGCSGATPVCVEGVCRQCEDSTSTAGAVDFGCAAASPACDVSGAAPACVTCLEDDDCATEVCNATSHACDVCRDDQNSAADEGCGEAAPHCDVSAAPVCAACIDDQSGDDDDLGCGGDTPLCEVGAGPAHCVACIANDDGGEDLGCDAALPVCADAGGGARSCVACADDQVLGMPDRGCPAQAPVCDTNGDQPICTFCLDDEIGADMSDSGCEAPAPFCDDAGDLPRCVTCFDDREGAGVDFGCDGERSFCDASGDAPICVYCLDSERGARDLGCTEVAPACVVLEGLHVCVECEDDQNGDDADFGCEADAPYCDAESPLGGCVECLDSGDCDDDLRCNAGHQCAAGCTDDDQCSGELAACDEEQEACALCTDDDASACADALRGSACVSSRCGCTTDDDCSSTYVCAADPGLCVPRSALSDPDAGVPAPSEPDPSTPDAGAPGATAPITRLRGGSHCSTTTPGSPSPLPALSLLLLLRRRKKGDGPA